nr:chorion class high cysteine protein 12 [Hymenolepis microstoma]
MFLRTVVLCLLICSIGRAYFHSPINPNYDFSRCSGTICRSGQSIGYGCINGNCTYVCSDGFCSGYKGYRGVLPPISHEYLVRPWGHGVVRYQGGCNGGNCGYWGGCMNNYCGGYYDFRGCPYMDCTSGPFHGHGCVNGNCEIVCKGRNCYIVSAYGTPLVTEPKRRNKTFENEPEAPSAYKPYKLPQYRPLLEDIGETFRSEDMWMLKNLNSSEIYKLVKSWIKDEKVFSAMKPDGDEVKFILSQFRKRNRMQTRLALWREGKKARMYFDTLCPYKRDQFYECPYTIQYPPMIPYQPCPQLPPMQYTPTPRMPYHSPFHPPQSYYNPGRFHSYNGVSPGWKPWPQPQVPNLNPGGLQRSPMTLPPPAFPKAQSGSLRQINPQVHPWLRPLGSPQSHPRIPPQVPVNCPGGFPWQKPPMINSPSGNPQGQHWVAPPVIPQGQPLGPPPVNPQAPPLAPFPLNRQGQPWGPPPVNPQASPLAPSPFNPQIQPWGPPPLNSQAPPLASSPLNPQGQPWGSPPLNPQAPPWAPSPLNPQVQPWGPPPVHPQGQPGLTPQVNSQSQPWVPPQVPINCPGGCPWQKSPIISPQPLYPRPPAWASPPGTHSRGPIVAEQELQKNPQPILPHVRPWRRRPLIPRQPGRPLHVGPKPTFP